MLKRLIFILSMGVGLISAKTVMVLPVHGDVQKNEDIETISQLFIEGIKNHYHGEVKTPQDSAHQCGEKECAEKLATDAKVDEVIFTTVMRLGSKWIFSSTIMDANGNNAFNQRGTALTMEDLEPITRRVSDAILTRKTFDQVATLDNITAKEENNEPTRRKSLYTSGFTLGYLYPTGNSYSYLKYNGTTLNSSETQEYSQLIRFSWINSWEFRENLMLGFELNMAPPLDFGGDINMQYLFNKTDITPFIGGGLGIHYVTAKDEVGVGTYRDKTYDDSKRNSGPTANIQGGMVFFRTYDIHLITRAQYQVVFNSDIDNGIAIDVGVVYRPKEKSESSSGWSKFWMYYLVGALVVSAMGSAMN